MKNQYDELYDWLCDNNSSWGFDAHCKLIEKGYLKVNMNLIVLMPQRICTKTLYKKDFNEEIKIYDLKVPQGEIYTTDKYKLEIIANFVIYSHITKVKNYVTYI